MVRVVSDAKPWPEDLREAWAKTNELWICELQEGARDGVLWKIDRALKNGADIHHENELVLRWAAEYGRTEAVGFLLEHGADANGQGGKDALCRAKSNGYDDTAKVLEEWMRREKQEASPVSPQPG